MPRRPPGSMPRSRPARAPTPRSFSTPPAPPAAPRAWCCRPSAASAPPPTRSRSTSSTENDEALAYLPLAWVGDHYLNYAQGLVAGFCMACPESATPRCEDLREIGPTFYLRAAAHVRAAADPRHDPHGGRRLHQAPHVPLFHRRGAALRREASSTASRCRSRPAALSARQYPGLCAAEERARLLPRARRLHRGRGDRPRPVLVLSLARPQPEAALRPDRSVPLCHRAAGRRNLCRHGRPAAPTSTSASPTTARCSSSRPACSSAISRTRPRPPRR